MSTLEHEGEGFDGCPACIANVEAAAHDMVLFGAGQVKARDDGHFDYESVFKGCGCGD